MGVSQGRRTTTSRPGTGEPLRPYRVTQAFSRTLFFIDLPGESGGTDSYAVDVNHHADEMSDSDPRDQQTAGDSPTALYRDGMQILRSDLPAVFPVPGGVIEVATSMYGLRRMHHVDSDGRSRVLRPHPLAPEGLRAEAARRAPRASRAVGDVAVGILLLGLAMAIPEAWEALTRLDVIAARLGTFRSPVDLPGALDTILVIAMMLASVERALTLRSHRLVDFDSLWTDDE